MGLSEEIRQRLINTFKVEQREHTTKITQGLLALEKNPSDEVRQSLLNEIFREAHSLKGSARAVGLTTIESLGHGMEGLLLRAKEGELDFSAELFDLLYQTLDIVEVVINQIEQGHTAPSLEALQLLARLNEAIVSSEPSEAATTETAVSLPTSDSDLDEEETLETESPGTVTAVSDNETIRVSVNKLDSLMSQFSELLTAKVRVEQRLVELHQVRNVMNEWHKEWITMRHRYHHVVHNGGNTYSKDMVAVLEFVDKNQEYLYDLSAQVNVLSRQLANDNTYLRFMLNELEEEIKQVRMLPLSTITVSFSRMVRDMARQQNKQIALTMTGGETELDKHVLEQMKAPLIHLLRNAVDHGIEAPETRQKVGKSPTGHITLKGSQQGHNIVIEIQDDGSGLDLAAIRKSAVNKGILSKSEARKLSDEEVTSLIFESGLSTSKMITDISGRGIGLDVVRQNVEQLHGLLSVTSHPGQGCVFCMTLPLTLVSSRGILIHAGEQIFALPISGVERMLTVAQSDVSKIEGRNAIIYEDKPIAIAWLEDLLELPSDAEPMQDLVIIVITTAERRLGLVVNKVVGEQEIVIKNMGKQLAKLSGIAGATIMGSGEVILVLHPADLVKLAENAPVRKPVELQATHTKKETKKKVILVVDDSITTRTLEKNILEAAGYQVNLATNGEEALGSLVSGELPHLIVSDINMPHLSGFELTTRIKQDGRYQAIPIILVTSLDSPTDKAHGIEVGADAYIVKSRFDQGNLLETIAQLI